MEEIISAYPDSDEEIKQDTDGTKKRTLENNTPIHSKEKTMKKKKIPLPAIFDDPPGIQPPNMNQ